MHSVYFVEDEAAVRQAIIDTVDWESAGFCICGQAGNGETALREILSLKPDVLITDIKMPGMDGLELSRLVKKELPDTEILILSGYGDYDFTHRAIRIGVLDYILKPVTPQKLLQTLGRTAEHIQQKQDEKLRRKLVEAAPAQGMEGLFEGQEDEIRRIVDRGQLTQFVKTAGREEVDSFAAKQADLIWNAAQHSKLFFLCCLYDLFTTAGDAAAAMGIATPPMRSFLQPEDTFASQAELEEQLREYFGRILHARDEMADAKSQLVVRARRFIDDNHSDPELSLGTVAASIGVTANYLSLLINRETGISFSDCVNNARVKHAMELLKSTALPLSEIAHEVGYNDQYYLSKIFKKTLGVSPREFKKM